jgi:hypothetical protein
MSRLPSGQYEERIDYEQIVSAQDRRHAETISELRGLLLRIERQTIAFAVEELAKRKNKTSPAKYSVPLSNKYREILRRRILASHRRGRQDVAGEVGVKIVPAMSGPEMSRVRAQADLLTRDHISRLETDLRREWTKAMQGNIDRRQIEYVTRKVFADFAGWEQPTP